MSIKSWIQKKVIANTLKGTDKEKSLENENFNHKYKYYFVNLINLDNPIPNHLVPISPILL